MVTLFDGNRIDMLISVLSVSMEYPMQSLKLLGPEQTYRNLVYDSISPGQAYCNAETGEVYEGKLFTVSGRVPNRTIRFYKKGLEVLKWNDSFEAYLQTSSGHKISGNLSKVKRNHAVAEVLAVMARCAVEFRPQALPNLRMDEWGNRLPNKPLFYTSRQLKRFADNDGKETIYTRLIGALFIGSEYYSVYNARKEVLRWDNNSESKANVMLMKLAKMNTMATEQRTAIVFGESMETMEKTLEEMSEEKRTKKQTAPVVEKSYRDLYYIPLTEKGIRMFRMFLVPDWREKILSGLYKSSERSYNKGHFEYDALVDGVYSFSFLDGNIARLIRFKNVTDRKTRQTEVLCFDFQEEFLRNFLDERVMIYPVSMEDVEKTLKLKE